MPNIWLVIHVIVDAILYCSNEELYDLVLRVLLFRLQSLRTYMLLNSTHIEICSILFYAWAVNL